MHDVRAVLIADSRLGKCQSAVYQALSQHSLIKVGLTICLDDWLRSTMMLNPELGDLAMVALADGSQHASKLALKMAKQPVSLPTIVALGSTQVFVVEAYRDGPFCGSSWVDASSSGIDAALGHILKARESSPCLTSLMGSAVDGPRLSAQQATVLCLFANGLSGKHIGCLLGISAKTVSSHKRRVMDKLGINNLPDLIRIADHNRAALMAVAGSVLGPKLRTVIPARPAYTEPTRLKLKRAFDQTLQ